MSNLSPQLGASAAAMLIFILPSAFYIKLVKKESMKSVQKIGVRRQFNIDTDMLENRQNAWGITRKPRIFRPSAKRVNPSSPLGHPLPDMRLHGHDRQYEPHRPGLDPQRHGQHRRPRRRTLKLRLSCCVPRRGERRAEEAPGGGPLRPRNRRRSKKTIVKEEKTQRTHLMLGFDFPERQKTMPFWENVSELCTVCCYRPHRWCFTCFVFFLFLS